MKLFAKICRKYALLGQNSQKICTFGQNMQKICILWPEYTLFGKELRKYAKYNHNMKNMQNYFMLIFHVVGAKTLNTSEYEYFVFYRWENTGTICILPTTSSN